MKAGKEGKMTQCSKLFEDTFFSGCSGCVRTCSCGKIYYDTYNESDWEEGEFEALEKDPNAFPLDYSVSTISIGGEEIVIGCDCDRAERYENFILANKIGIAEYLNKRAETLRCEADNIEINQTTTT